MENNKHILGIDVARCIALFGMIIVNFKLTIGHSIASDIDRLSYIFAQAWTGKAVATFVTLAGVGLSLMTKGAVVSGNSEQLTVKRKLISKRALFLFVFGLSYIEIWPADILHFYGVYMLVALWFVTKPKQGLWLALLLVLVYPLLTMVFDYEAGWDFNILEYPAFWTWDGFFRNLLFNGFHPVLPWVAFMLIGVWFGQQDLHDEDWLKKVFKYSLLAFLGLQVFSSMSLFALSNDVALLEELKPVLGTEPMPPFPLYMMIGSCVALAVISGCILLGKRFSKSKTLHLLAQTGQLTLTFYFLHELLGMGLIDGFTPELFGHYPMGFTLGYALIFCIACVFFTLFWKQFFQRGPVEWLMRRVTG